MTVRQERVQRGLISTFIAAVLLCQLAAAIGGIRKLAWPFMDYPMYQTPHYEGDTITKYVVYGLLDDGREVLIEPQDLGLDFFHFKRGFVVAIHYHSYGEEEAGWIEQYRTLYETRHGVTLAGVRLEDHPWVLRRSRAERVPNQVVNVLRFDGRGEEI